MDQIDLSREKRRGGPTQATSVYDRLRRDIIVGRLAPGEKLGSEFLRDRYSAGVSPVREALNRLVSEHLVCSEDQRGFHVAGVSRGDLADLIRMRCWIEDIAIRRAIDFGGDDWEEAIIVAFHRLSRIPRSAQEDTYSFNPDWEIRHRMFHYSLIAACASQRLLDQWQLFSDQADRYRQLAATIAYPDRAEGGEHKEIMEATLARDADRAVALQAAHIRKTEEIILASGMSLPAATGAA